MDRVLEDNCNDTSTSTNPAAAASSSTQAMHLLMSDAAATNRDEDASCQNYLCLDEDEEEVFFGPVSDKEKQKASAYARRRTAVFRPGASGNHLRKRVTMAPSDLLPTLNEMGTDNSPSKACNGAGDSQCKNYRTENDLGCCATSTSGEADQNGVSHKTKGINCTTSSKYDYVQSTNGITIEPVSKDMEKALRRDSLLVIQELKNHRKDDKRCGDLDCSLCILDDDNQGTSALLDKSIVSAVEDIPREPLITTDHQETAMVNHSDNQFVTALDHHSHEQSVTASDGYNSDDDFLLMEQSCHESFGEDGASPEKSNKLDTTVDCITKSISKLRMKPLTIDCHSVTVHAFSRYTPIRQAQSQETFVAATPEDDIDDASGVVFTEKSFSPNLMFKDVRKPLLFNEKTEESHAPRSESSAGHKNLTVETSHMPESPAFDSHTQSNQRINVEMANTVDIIDIACHDKSCFDLNTIEGNTSSENSFEQETSESVCSSEEGSNKENQPQVSSRQAFQTPPRQRIQGFRHVVSEQRPSSLQLHSLDDESPFSPTSAEGASPMTMEEILARKKAQMQQLRQEQQKFTEKLTSRHSPSPARELSGKKGLTRSPLTGSFRSPTARLPNTLPRVRYKDSQSLSLEGKQLEAVTKLHTMCNSQRSVKLVHRPRKAHSTRIVTVVADERQRIKWSDLKSAMAEHVEMIEDSPDSGKSARRKSIIKVRPNNNSFPYGDESPASVIISKTAHHASSLQKAVIDKVSTYKQHLK